MSTIYNDWIVYCSQLEGGTYIEKEAIIDIDKKDSSLSTMPSSWFWLMHNPSENWKIYWTFWDSDLRRYHKLAKINL